ncbi:hypothetical protein NLG97_g7765 [Lecanicillium saksenae]|uniref:Uncharacterized protein n=1 Tax=Lecanicillium saksenae TaxID=468837 RepID=A0ACC1QKW3_9HYPO|nr:hypothetical protein NLG97_g7765 [Lecanicillium saksenae]
MSQYDSIGSSYSGFNDSVYRRMESHSCESAIKPHLKPGSHVADFACGNGYMTRKLLEWGCASVVGIDLSPVMVQDAQRLLVDQVSTGRAQFSAADATVLQSVAPHGEMGYFDAVVGGWLVNYAPDSAALVAMFTNIALNLNDDGFFFGIMPHPTNDLEKRAAIYKEYPFTHAVPKNTYTSPLESGQGWNLQVQLPDNVHLDTFHLKKDVIEDCARLGGLKGRLEWKTEVLLGDDWKKLFNADMTEQDWQLRSSSPHFGILIVYKN